MINSKIDRALRTAKYRRKETVSDAIARTNSNYAASAENRELLYKCQQYWQALARVRSERARNLRYKNGDQWSDRVIDPDSRTAIGGGKLIREDELISRNGRVPLKHNFIQQFVRNIAGQQLGNPSQSVVVARSSDDAQLGEMLTNALQTVNHLNEVSKLDLSALEEILLAGIVCAKVRYDFWCTKNRNDGRLELVNINRLFFNTDIEDPRFTDMNLIGEIHDYTMDDLLKNFAVTKADETTLKTLYRDYNNSYIAGIYGMEASKVQELSFLYNSNSVGKCRVIEVWEKCGRWVTYLHDYADGTQQITPLSMSEIDEINRGRAEACASAGIECTNEMLIYAEPKYEHYWNVKFLTPDGTCLKEIETPYTHEEHPYIIATLPMADGEIRSGIADLIDMQRYINRLIVMIDFIMSASAKGVLMVPETAIPDGYTIEDFTSEYVKANGVIVYKPTPGREAPYQVSSNSTNVGAWEMLSMQMNLIQQISGLSGAIQGQTAKSGTPSSLYAQQAQNSMINYKVVFETFRSYVAARDEKMIKVLMQFYTDKRYVDISGKSYSETAKFYNPQMAAKIVDFNVRVTQSTDTPVYRQITDDMLFNLLQMGVITPQMFLQNSSMPFADKLLNDIEKSQEKDTTPLTTEAPQTQQYEQDNE